MKPTRIISFLLFTLVVAGCSDDGGNSEGVGTKAGSSNSSIAGSGGGGAVDVTVEERCLTSGGVISASTCCAGVSDFPNLCLVGACGCAPESSHQIQVCTCPDGQCFDGTGCVAR